MTTTANSHTQDRIWTAGRIAALLAIAVAVAGLAYVALARPAGWAELPDGARAGQLELEPCTYPTERGDVRADCGTLVVPENRADPDSRLIALPVTRIRSRSPRPAEPIFRLEGGPGQSNMTFPYASRYLDRRDVVLVGYRGVDGSARLDCPEVSSARRHNGDLLRAASLRASERALRDCAQRLRGDGFDLAGYTLAQRVDDLDAARVALGYGRVDLLSESFGTRVALVYAWRHPRSIHRSVMIGVNPPGAFVWQPAHSDAQLRRFAQACGQPCRTQGGDLVAAMRRTAADMPTHWGPLPIHGGNARIAAFFGLMQSSSAAGPISAPATLDAWRAAATGDASGLWFESFAAALIMPRMQVWGDSAAMARVDAAFAERHFAPGSETRSVLGDPGSRYLWAAGALARAWPAAPGEDRYALPRTTSVATLMVSGEYDGATPAANARRLLPYLPNGRHVVLRGFGHTADFWNNQVAAGTRLVDVFLDSGRVDASRYVAQRIDFTPSTTQTRMAKMIAGAMVGLALVTLLGLAWMARRVRARGRLGAGTRVVARSAGALLLGLGGWVGVALVALVVLPGVPIDAALALVGGMALPAAMASHLGWRGPDRVAANAAGRAAALAGALAGAGLGLQCATAPLSILTTLVGAVAGANLALVACDVAAQAGRRRRRPPALPPIVATTDEREPVRQAARA